MADRSGAAAATGPDADDTIDIRCGGLFGETDRRRVVEMQQPRIADHRGVLCGVAHRRDDDPGSVARADLEVLLKLLGREGRRDIDGQRADLPIGMPVGKIGQGFVRSEEHTSELRSLMRISYAVFCLKKKTNNYIHK